MLSLLAALPSLAQEDGLATYDPSAGAGAITSFTGVGYLALVAFFLFRLFQRRAKRATTERIGGSESSAENDSDSDEEDEQQLAQEAVQAAGKTTPVRALIGTVQVTALAVGMYFLAVNVEAYMVGMQLPDNYTARNIGSTLRVSVVGAAYLATFVFSANALGLAALTLKLAMFGDDEGLPGRRAQSTGQALPRLRVTDNIGDIRAAFDQIESDAARKAADKSRKS